MEVNSENIDRDHKIDFIIASNQERAFRECRFYIEHLKVPAGYHVNVYGITQAKSMAAAYNEGMRSSEAKYKIYLHQDVFIWNRDFLLDILSRFQADQTIGLIGVLGGTTLPADGIVFNAWNTGRVKVDNASRIMEINWQQDNNDVQVEAVDGLLMATQYDLAWREDLFTEWDFYDISQSFEFRQQGYRVIVPCQSEAWCLHDCGISRLYNYERGREIFYREYCHTEMGEEESIRNIVAYEERMYDILQKLIGMMEQDGWDQVSEVLQLTDEELLRDTELRNMRVICQIYEEEKKMGGDFFSLKDAEDWPILQASYQNTKYMLRRIEQGWENEAEVDAFLLKVREKRISVPALENMINRYIFDIPIIVTVLNKAGVKWTFNN